MPSIKDESTREAIAREFTSNGRKKQETLSTVGYADSYALEGGRGCEVVFSNVLVKAAIARIDKENRVKYEADRKGRQMFWADTMNTAPNMGDRLRASELLGRSEADFTDNINSNSGQAPDPLTDTDRAELADYAKHRTTPKLVKETA